MSFDEKQPLDNDEINLVELFRSIWFYKFSLLLFIILCTPVSVYYSSTIQPKYKAETVFEKAREVNTQNNSSLLNNVEGSRLFSFISGVPAGGASDSFYSEIRSASLLKTVILNNDDLANKKLNKFCNLPSKSTPRFSLRSLLILLGLSENKNPTEAQKTSLLVKCVNDMLEIDFDTFGSSVSSAYRLSIISPDPIFSANLANQIVEKYFVRHEKRKDQDFQNVKKYLSKVIAEAQTEFTEANKLIQRFKIKHTLLMNINPLSSQPTNSSTSGGDILSPFAPELNSEIAYLSQLEKSLSQLNEAFMNLSKLNDPDQEMIRAFLSSTELQGVFSRTFVTSISKIDNASKGSGFKNQKIEQIVTEELQSLKQQIKALEDKIVKREEQTMQLMTIENRFQELSIDVYKKKLLFEGLKDQLKEKILTTGLSNVDQPILLTRAVAPFGKDSPNKKMIVALGVVLSFFAGVAYIVTRQSFLRKIHSLSQLQKLGEFLYCYKIKSNQLKLVPEKSDETVISQSFFSRIKGRGKLGCIIDLSQKKINTSLASTFSETVASILSADGSKILCLDQLQSKGPFNAKAQRDIGPNYNDRDAQSIPDRGIFKFFDEEGMISAGDTQKIKNRYSDYDKVICALGDDISDLAKFKFIEQCDFYILIGRSFHFDEYTYKKFSNTVWEKEKKCVGFFLVV